MNWIPIFGDFTLNDSKIVFNGSIDNNLWNVQIKQGLIFDQKMLAGKIKVDIEFGTKELQRNKEAELIFDYIDEHNFKCVGITGNAYKLWSEIMYKRDMAIFENYRKGSNSFVWKGQESRLTFWYIQKSSIYYLFQYL